MMHRKTIAALAVLAAGAAPLKAQTMLEHGAISAGNATAAQGAGTLSGPLNNAFGNVTGSLPGNPAANAPGQAPQAQAADAQALAFERAVELEAKRNPKFKRNGELLGAAEAGQTWNVKAALAKGADIEVRDAYHGFTPLMWAAWGGHLGTVRYLLDHGAKVNARSVTTPGAAVTLAAGHATPNGEPMNVPANATAGSPAGQLQMFSLTGFVSEGNGLTPLILAASNGWGLTVKELLRRGADPHLASRSGDTALAAAAFSGYLPAVRALLEAGAKVDAKDFEGGTALVSATLEGHTAVVQELLHRGADAGVVWRGMTLPDLARYLGHDAAARLLRPAARRAAKTTKRPLPPSAPPVGSGNDFPILIWDPALGQYREPAGNGDNVQILN